MSDRFKIRRSNDNDLRQQIGTALNEIDDDITDIIDYLGAVPPGGIVLDFEWSTLLTGDPTSGHISADNTDQALVTELRMSITSANGNNVSVIIDALRAGDILGIFQQPAPQNTSYFDLTDTPVLDGTGQYYVMAVTPSVAAGQALPVAQDDPCLIYFIGNPNRQLPPGGDNDWILVKQSSDDYDVDWEDGTNLFTPISHYTDYNNPHQVTHSQVLSQTPDDHHNQVHKLYLGDHSDVIAGGGLNIRSLLATPDAVDFQPEYRMNWRGGWGPGQYYTHDVVYDAGWTMAANKPTTDRAAPQTVGDAVYTLPESPGWTTYQNTSVIYSGHLYTFTDPGYFRALRVWVPELVGNTNYRIVIVRNPNGASPVYTSINDPVLNENAWTILSVDTVLVTPGEELLVYIDALNSGSQQTWAYNWLYGGQVQNVAPVSGDWQINQQETVLGVNWLDAEAVPVDHQLELQVVPNTIFEVSEIGNPANFRHYQVQGAYTEGAGFTQYTVQIVDTGGTWPPALGEPTQVRAVQPISDPTKFVGIDAYWGPGTLPAWAGIVSFLQYDGVPQAVQGDEAYGVDIAFQVLVASDDWDIVSIAGGGGAGGGEGTPFPEAPNDGQVYGRSGELVDWVPVYTKQESDDTFTRLDDLLWGVDNTDHTAEWGDRTLIEGGPSIITLPVSDDTDPVDDLVLWNNGSQATHITTVVPAAGHAFVYDGDTSVADDPFTLEPGEMVRITPRTVNLYNVAIEAAAPFNGPGSPGHVPDPGVSSGKFLSDDGTWQAVVTSGAGLLQLEYIFSTAVSGAPLQGEVYVNNADPSLATEITFHMTTSNGNRFQQLWQTFQIGDVVWVVDQVGGNNYGYKIAGSGVPDNPDWALATYVTFAVGDNDIVGSIADQTPVNAAWLTNPGARLPPDGTTGQHLAKTSDADYDTEWVDAIDEAPDTGWSHARQWNGADMEWNSHPVFEGNVGIGTTSPAYKLEVHSDLSGVSDALLLKNNTGAANTGARIAFQNNNVFDSCFVQSVREGSGAPISLAFGTTTNYNTTDAVERMRITGAGNVGIGATVPSYNLHVQSTDSIKVVGLFQNTAIDSAYVSFQHSASTNNFGNRIGSAGGDTITIDTAGSERMRITSAGNVGIGTTSPVGTLHVQGGSVPMTIKRTGGEPYTLYGQDSANTTRIYAGGTASHMRVTGGDGSGEVFRIDAAGNVGIAQTAPLHLLHVGDNAVSGSKEIRLERHAGAEGRISIAYSDTNVGLRMRVNSSEQALIEWDGWATPQNEPLIFASINNGEHMRITSAGNVGIGTSNPQKTFVISNKTNASGGIGFEFEAGADGSIYPTGGRMITFDRATSKFVGTRLDASEFIFAISTSGAAGTERMRITSAGNVGIGTTNPIYGRLEVRQSVDASDEGIAVTNSGGNYTGRLWCDGAVFTITGGGTGNRDIRYNGNRHFWEDENVEFMRSYGDGRLIIGGTAPTSQTMLSIDGNGRGWNNCIGIRGADPYISWYPDGGTARGAYMQHAGNRLILNVETGYLTLDSDSLTQFINGGSERVRITSDGNVGIGTISPSYKLEVNGDINLDGSSFNFYKNGVPIETFTDAPADGNTYGRNNNAWVLVSGGGGTISNLTSSPTTTYVDIDNTGGTDARILEATSTRAGVMTAQMHDDLDAVAGSAKVLSGTSTGQLLMWDNSNQWWELSTIIDYNSPYLEVNTNIDATGYDMICDEFGGSSMRLSGTTPLIEWNDTGASGDPNFTQLAGDQYLFILGSGTTSNSHFRYQKATSSSSGIDALSARNGAVFDGTITAQVVSYMTPTEREALVDAYITLGVLTPARGTQIKTKLAADIAQMISEGVKVQIT